jgi:hypothetical protein
MPEGRRNIFVNRSISANCATKFFFSLLVVGDRFFGHVLKGESAIIFHYFIYFLDAIA